jgi:Tol biopolymer transport system component
VVVAEEVEAMRRLPVVGLFVVGAVLASAVLAAGSTQTGAASSGLIAFTRPDGVYVMRTDGSGVRLLRRTGGAYVPGSVAWSPDGRKLAYVSSGTEAGGLWVMNADGSHPVRLLDASASRPTWSPDSARIAFVRSDRSGVWVVNADGSSLRQLTPRWAGTPDWSPDGSRIAFTHMAPYLARNGVNVQPNDEIWVMNANGGSRMRLTRNHVVDHDPVWSPDSSKIAYVAAFAGFQSSEIYVINADGTGFTRLTHNHVAEGSPAWQPALPAS